MCRFCGLRRAFYELVSTGRHGSPRKKLTRYWVMGMSGRKFWSDLPDDCEHHHKGIITPWRPS